MKPTRKVAAYGLLMLAASLNAAAADQGFYFGVIGGRADYEFEKLSFPFVSAIPSLDVLPITRLEPGVGAISLNPVAVRSFVLSPQWQPGDDDESSALGIVAGYRIMRYAAVELNYLDLGKLEETDSVNLFPPPLTSTLQFKRELETTGPSITALGILPIVDQWSVYARAGVFFARSELTSSLGGGEGSTSFGSDSFVYGAGTQFDWGKHWSVRADFQRFDSVGEETGSGRADIDLMTVGFIFRL